MTEPATKHATPILLEAWREAERATDRARTAAEAARRAAVAAAKTALAIADTARHADETLAAAERARDVARRAAGEASRLSGVAEDEHVLADDAVVDAEAATGRARDAFHDSERGGGGTEANSGNIVAEVLESLREGERLLEELPPLSPDHETVRLAVTRLRATHDRLTSNGYMTREALVANRAVIISARWLLKGISEHRR